MPKKKWISTLYRYLLSSIDDHDGKWTMPKQKVIAEAMGYSDSAVSKAIGMLVQDGVVKKTKDKKGVITLSKKKKKA